MRNQLRRQLLEIGIDPTGMVDPHAAWLALFGAIWERATLIDRYEIEAMHFGIEVDQLTREDRLRMRNEVLPVLFPGWTERGAALQIDPIIVVPYDPAWPAQFTYWRNRLHQALAPLEVRIEHVGSTAVPGLAAKPIIDIMVGVPDVEDEGVYSEGIASCGVPLRSADAGHRYFRPAWPDPRVVQIHVVDVDGEWQRRHLLFRDYLRAHPEAAAAYGSLKMQLATKYTDDRLAYNAAKTDFILNHMEHARKWSGPDT